MSSAKRHGGRRWGAAQHRPARGAGARPALACLLLPVVASTVVVVPPAGERPAGAADEAASVTPARLRSVPGAAGHVYDVPIVLAAPGGDSPRSAVSALLWQAYAQAVASAPAHCHLPLSLLAAIGQVESGSLSGRALDPGHRVVPPVLGPVLDGTAFAAVADTDRGTLDGDTRWDRAVGPMQFLPGTWVRWGSDGDGDGVLDPQDIDDATVAAAEYLCAEGRDLADPADLEAAVLAYNHSRDYLELILGWKDRLDGALPVQPPPHPPVATQIATQVPPAPQPVTGGQGQATLVAAAPPVPAPPVPEPPVPEPVPNPVPVEVPADLPEPPAPVPPEESTPKACAPPADSTESTEWPTEEAGDTPTADPVPGPTTTPAPAPVCTPPVEESPVEGSAVETPSVEADPTALAGTPVP
ncbi:lytic transglycosylase domain-containing protein [Nocardioides kongjuensis]|uniref:Transglycosylase SLT domain-containing protein n=1 Tax=Nocardioides kongjuensis TaxID=349522 RepID=A0A852RJ73_9ACTN|nr:lytic transglycosylase domain-containing protein [Nocardioides kongjuensis]NYD30629.1 hypothetical protein [Nocardioides kongjuensis]